MHPNSLQFVQNSSSEEDVIWNNAALGTLAIALVEIGEGDRAIKLALQVENEDIQLSVFPQLIWRLAREGKSDRVEEVLPGNSQSIFPILRDVFLELIDRGYSDSALELAQFLEDRYDLPPNFPFFMLAGTLAAKQELDRAWEMVVDLENSATKNRVLYQIALEFAAKGNSDRVLDIVEAIDGEATQVDILPSLAIQLAEAGELENALEIARSLSQVESKIQVLSVIGFQFANAEKMARSQTIFSEAIALISQLEAGEVKNSLLNDLAVYLARGKDFDRALEMSQKIAEASRTETLFYISGYFAEAGEFDRAVTILQQIEVLELREAGARKIAIELAKKGDSDRALDLVRSLTNADEILHDIATILVEKEQFDRALEIADRIDNAEFKTVTLGAIASHLYYDEQEEKAEEIITRTLQFLQTIEDPIMQDSLLEEIVANFIENENYDRALELLQDPNHLEFVANTSKNIAYLVAEIGEFASTLKFVELIENPFEKIGVLLFLSIELAEKEELEQAKQALSRAIIIAEELPDRDRKALMLSSIATQFSELGDRSQAEQIVKQVLALLSLETLSFLQTNS